MPKFGSSVLSVLLCTDAFYLLFQEHPFIFTRANSLGTAPTGLTSTTVDEALTFNPDSSLNSVPSWTAALMAVGGLLIGVATTWLVIHYRERKKRQKIQNLRSLELKGVAF